MSYASIFAVYFIFWWITLFAILPFSLRTQDDDGETTLGTVSSAPRGSHVRRAMLRTTVVSLLLYGLFFATTRYFGLSLNDIPQIVPDFR
jgi:predicted secreted protein